MITNIDNKLFEFFQELNGIINYKDEYKQPNSLSILYEECEEILNTHAYSNINVQDEYGNTFLHYVMPSLNMTYILRLIDNGANPLIQNNQNNNAFQQKISQQFLAHFYKYFEKKSIYDFPIFSQNYNLEFKQFIFEYILEKQNIFIPCHEISLFLQKCNLDTVANTILSISKLTNPEISSTITYINNLNTTAEQNSLILGNSTIFKKHHTMSQYKVIMNFITKSEFTFDYNFFKFLKKHYSTTYYNQFNDIIDTLFKKIVDNNYDIKQPILIPNTGNQYVSLYDVINEQPEIAKIFLTFQLNKELSMNQNNSKTQRKI
jgi:hypothetical protein